MGRTGPWPGGSGQALLFLLGPKRTPVQAEEGHLAGRAPGPRGSPVESLTRQAALRPRLCFHSRSSNEQRPEDDCGECC